MNASAASTVARAAGIVLIVALAIAAGLAAGNLMQQVNGDRSITAAAGFSLDAIEDLHALRDDGSAAVAAPAYVDYALRHAAKAADYPDFGIRHQSAAAPAPVLTDTFRLTGPSEVDSDAR